MLTAAMFGTVFLLVATISPVTWVAPESCSSPDFSALSLPADGTVEVKLDSPGETVWNLEIQFLTPFLATRKITLGSCGESQKTALVLIQLAFSGTKSVPVVPAAQMKQPQVFVEEIEHDISIVPFAHLGAVVSAGTLSRPTTRFVFAGGIRVASFEIELNARTSIPSIQLIPSTQSEVSIWPALGTELVGCWSPLVGHFTLGGCVTAVIEWWRFAGLSGFEPEPLRSVLAGIGVQARISYTLDSGIMFGLAASMRINVSRPGISFDGERFLTAGPQNLDLGAWIGFRWPEPQTESSNKFNGFNADRPLTNR
jgi:hypothetical protein